MDTKVVTREQTQDQQFTQGLLALHAKASPNLLDLERNTTVFMAVVLAPLTRIFIAPRGVLLIVQGIVPTQGAVVSILNARPIVYKHRNELLTFLGEVMDALQLPRVTFLTASPRAARLAMFFGMLPEGEMRKAGLMEGKLETVQIFGMLREEMSGHENTRENPVEQAQAPSEPEEAADARAIALVSKAFPKHQQATQ